MGKLTDEMQRLRDGIDAGYEQRAELISNLHDFHDQLAERVNKTLSDFRQVHEQTSQHLKEQRVASIQASAEQLRNHLNDYRSDLSDRVANLRRTHQKKHADCTQAVQAHLQNYMHNLSTSVENIRQSAQQQMADFKEKFQGKSTQEHHQRETYVARLQEEIGDLRERLNEDRLQAAQIFAGNGKKAANSVERSTQLVTPDSPIVAVETNPDKNNAVRENVVDDSVEIPDTLSTKNIENTYSERST